MSGFAIPHAKSQTINEPSMIIATLNKGIEWNSLDRQSVDFILRYLFQIQKQERLI